MYLPLVKKEAIKFLPRYISLRSSQVTLYNCVSSLIDINFFEQSIKSTHLMQIFYNKKDKFKSKRLHELTTAHKIYNNIKHHAPPDR